MPAAFGKGLVLDMETRDSRPLKGADRVSRVQGVPIARIHIRDGGNADRVDDLSQSRGDLGWAEQAQVRNPRTPGHRTAANIYGREAGALNQPSR